MCAYCHCAPDSRRFSPGVCCVACLVITLLLLAWAAPSAPRAASLEVQGVSRPMYNAQLSFALPGSIYAIAVKPGEAVKEGDLLMHLDSRAEDSRISLLDSEIQSTIKIRTLQTKIEQARLDMQRYANALTHKAATVMEHQHAKLAHNLSVLALEEELFRIEQLKRNREELLAQRERMYLYAPCDGYVEDVLVERGMAVDRNVPAMRLVSTDPLLVDLTLAVDKAMLVKEGECVEVFLPGSDAALQGTVAQVAKIAVLSSRTLRVRVHVPNPQRIPAGLMVTVRFPFIQTHEEPATLPHTQGVSQ